MSGSRTRREGSPPSGGAPGAGRAGSGGGPRPKATREPGAVDRRSFLGTVRALAAGGACAALGLGATGCASFPRVRAAWVDGTATIPVSAFGEGEGVVFDHPLEAMPVYVHRTPSGAYTAVLLRCTHRGCAVDPLPGELACPCHGSRFSPGGRVREGPADRSLPGYPVREEAGDLHIRLGPDHTGS